MQKDLVNAQDESKLCVSNKDSVKRVAISPLNHDQQQKSNLKKQTSNADFSR